MASKMLVGILLATLEILVFSRCDLMEFPQDMGCAVNYNEEKCVYEAYCVSIIEINVETRIYSDSTCMNEVFCEHYRYIPLLLYYRNMDSSYDLQLDSYNIKCSTLILDLSFNDYSYVPVINKLQNLKLLNISHNNVDIATLFNYNYELSSLEEVDFSYNNIDKIEINDEAFVYRRLKKLWLSHNKLDYIPEAIFNSFYDIEYLDLSYNRIANISQFTFEGVKKILFLQLSHNQITDLKSSLFRFGKLKELYINDNKIKNVAVRDFERLNDLEILDLSHNVIQALETNIFENSPYLISLNLSYNLLTTIDRNMFSSLINLQSVDLRRNEIIDMPTQLFFNKSLSYFSISENNIQGALKRGNFEGLKLITKLDLSNQRITTIEDYAFFGIENLSELLLNNNLIQILSKKSFKYLQKMVRLDLSFNKITQIEFNKEDLHNLQSMILHGNQISKIQKNCLIELSRLQFLDLSKNNISKIEPETFKNLINLNNLLISKNPLSGNLEAKTFEGLNSVPLIDLSFTNINVLQNYSFESMFRLNHFNISHSKINELQYNLFSNTGNVKILDLSHNQIEIFSVNTTHLSNLEELLLNDNQIKILNNDFLKGISLLKKIVMSHNFIEFIDDNHFVDQNNLRHVDLSFNSKIKINLSFISNVKELKTLILSGSPTNTSFENVGNISLTNLEWSHSNIQNVSELNLSILYKLEYLQLSNNNLTRLEVGAFSNLTNVGEIDISYNNINVIQPGIFKDNCNLKILNISHNLLFELRYGAFHGLVSLRVLDISYNLIGSLNTERFFEVESLEKLIADYNRITDVSFEDFRGTNLNILSIGDNPLTCDKIVNLRASSRSSLIITSIRNVKIQEENVYGITCNMNGNKKEIEKSVENSHGSNNEVKTWNDNILIEIRDILLTLKPLTNSVKESLQITNVNENNNLLTEIRDILVNLKSEKDKQSLFTSKIKENILKEMNDILLNLSANKIQVKENMLNFTEILQSTDSNNRTSYLSDTTTLTPTQAKKLSNKSTGLETDIITTENLLNILNNLKRDLNNAIIDKNKVYTEMEGKLLSLNNRIESLLAASPLSKSEKYTLNTESKQLIFVETCLGLILCILVCLVLFQIYRSRKFIFRRRSLTISTRQIVNAMDTSNV